ncbi:unnamed protein product [Timema podura]|uniref:Uncharacterized protein n=1 Tax=Timema podura TaxID=61482 RepID=A0ABN7NNN7_TIMPD|nr:unnamed protein product [Timema podura]
MTKEVINNMSEMAISTTPAHNVSYAALFNSTETNRRRLSLLISSNLERFSMVFQKLLAKKQITFYNDIESEIVDK